MFLNAPYLWGGRTVFGCDCSGFVQTVYKMMGIALERDSSQQCSRAMRLTHWLKHGWETLLSLPMKKVKCFTWG